MAMETSAWKHDLALPCSWQHLSRWAVGAAESSPEHDDSWQSMGRIKTHCKLRRGNVTMANTSLPEKRLQSTAGKDHTHGVGLLS